MVAQKSLSTHQKNFSLPKKALLSQENDYKHSALPFAHKKKGSLERLPFLYKKKTSR